MGDSQPTQDETIAAAIHESWRVLSVQQGWKMQPRLDQPYAALDEADKAENRAAGRRMGGRTARCGTTRRNAIPACQQAAEKEKDRSNIRQYPAFAARAGLCITLAA